MYCVYAYVLCACLCVCMQFVCGWVGECVLVYVGGRVLYVFVCMDVYMGVYLYIYLSVFNTHFIYLCYFCNINCVGRDMYMTT